MNWNAMKNLVYGEISNAIQSAVAYEPNKFETWAKAIEVVGKIVQPLVDNGTLNDYQIMCDDETNNEEVKKRNMFALLLGWKEREGDEWTVVEFMLSPSGMEVK